MVQMQTITIKGADLKREADKNEEFLKLAYYAANRQRNRFSTDIRQMRKNLINEGEAVDFERWLAAWKRLETLGMGSLIIGRNGKATRFKWAYSLKAIGRAAINGLDIKVQPITHKIRGTKHVNDYHDKGILSVLEPERIKAVVKSGSPVPRLRVVPPVTKSVESIKNVIHVSLRPDYMFEADLPKLTQAEADQICAAIRRCV